MERDFPFLALCRGWSREAGALSGPQTREAFFRERLPGLLREGPRWREILRAVARGAGGGCEAIFDNEVVLYRDPARVFSLRVYLFGPGEHTPVHDHSSWGVFGPAFGELEVVRYRPEAESGRLVPLPPRRLSPGEIESTQPLAEGIHRTGSPGSGSTLMVSVYGTPLRRLYIRFYDPETGASRQVFPPQLRRKRLAERMLAEWGAAGRPLPLERNPA
ncbi:MAG: hypothetical protein WHT06_06770 [Desulfobacterales bacterium]